MEFFQRKSKDGSKGNWDKVFHPALEKPDHKGGATTFIFVYLCHPEHRVLMFSHTEAALADVDTRGDFQSYFLSFHANL